MLRVVPHPSVAAPRRRRTPPPTTVELAGHPLGRSFTGTYDIANRVSKLAGAASGGGTTNYASSIAYASQGPISQFTLGNGLVENRSYDLYRQQPIGVTLGTTGNSTSVLNLGFAYCQHAPASLVHER